MKILFDNGVPKKLRKYLPEHDIETCGQRDWSSYSNGRLLSLAQRDFDVLITTDANIEYQQALPGYDIALLVLRAFDSRLESYLPLVPEIQRALEYIEAGQVARIYADPKLQLKDLRKGQKRHDNS